MKKILQYSRHLMRAKGRHGTHSPFVYTFVERVMRASAGKIPSSPQHYSRAAWRLLYKTIKHLQPAIIYVLPAEQALLQEISEALQHKLTIIPLPGSLNATAPAMLYLPCSPEYISLITTFLRGSKTQVLLKAPHTGKDSLEVWTQLMNLPEVKVSLDYWHFGLLVNDEVFKGSRQHFRLR